MEVPFEALRPETLQALIEEFVTRDGTDYGHRELSLEAKTQDVMRMLRKREICVVFDPETESCDIRSVDELLRPAKASEAPASPRADDRRDSPPPRDRSIDQRRFRADEAMHDQRPAGDDEASSDQRRAEADES